MDNCTWLLPSYFMNLRRIYTWSLCWTLRMHISECYLFQWSPGNKKPSWKTCWCCCGKNQVLACRTITGILLYDMLLLPRTDFLQHQLEAAHVRWCMVTLLHETILTCLDRECSHGYLLENASTGDLRKFSLVDMLDTLMMYLIPTCGWSRELECSVMTSRYTGVHWHHRRANDSTNTNPSHWQHVYWSLRRPTQPIPWSHARGQEGWPGCSCYFLWRRLSQIDLPLISTSFTKFVEMAGRCSREDVIHQWKNSCLVSTRRPWTMARAFCGPAESDEHLDIKYWSIVMKYLHTAKDRKLAFRGAVDLLLRATQLRLVLYLFLGWAEDSTDRKSYSRNMVSESGDLMVCHIHQQPVVAASLSEAEHIAMFDACKDGLYICYILGECTRSINCSLL